MRHSSLLPALRGRPSTGAGPPPPVVAPPGPSAEPGTGVRRVARVGTGLAAGALVAFAVVVAAVLRSDGHDHLDLVVRHDLLRPAGSPAAGLADLAAGLATPAVLAAVTVAAVVALWRGAHRPLLGAGLLAVAVSTTALVQLLALALSGVRPSTTVLLGLPVFDGSFPSVRTAAAVALWGGLALAGVLLLRHRTAQVLCAAGGLALSLLVAWGQLDRTRAWPTDVLAGWLLGVAAVGVAATLLATWPVLPDPFLPPEPVLPGPVLPEPVEDDPADVVDTPDGRRAGSGGTTLGR